MKIKILAAALLASLFAACNYTLTSEPTKLDKPARQVSKILFVENSERRTSDFFNSLRKDFIVASTGQPIQATFVRLHFSDKNLESRLPEAKKRDKPEALLVFECSELRGPKWGVWRNSATSMQLSARLEAADSGEKMWGNNYFLNQFWGVEVITDKLASKILEDLKVAGVLKN